MLEQPPLHATTAAAATPRLARAAGTLAAVVLALGCYWLSPDRALAAVGSAAAGAHPAEPGPLPDGSYMGLGSSSAAVRSLQRRLAAEGHPVSADGVFGPKTHAAVVRFQRAKGMTVDGVVGRQTMAGLRGRRTRGAGCAGEPGGCGLEGGQARLESAGKETPSPPSVSGSYIVVFKRSVQNVRAETERLERSRGFRSRLRYGRALKGFAGKLSRRQVDQLEADRDVAFVSPDRPVRASALVPLKAGDSAPTGVRRMDAAGAGGVHEASSAGVAVVDTGIDLAHPDLNAVNGKNCVGSGSAQDDEGHGTHVAGTIAARNNGSGVVGVAPGTKLFAVKVLDAQGSGSYSQVICGIDWATSTRTDSDPNNDISVLNMSLGGVGTPPRPCSGTTDPLHRAVCSSAAAGISTVVAAGNESTAFDDAAAPSTPAVYPEALTVTAMSDSDGKPGAAGGDPRCRSAEADDRYASFSNRATTSEGETHTTAAPGTCIYSTLPGGGYGTMSGTSMAAPHVAGAVALCLNEAGRDGPCAGLTPRQIVARFRGEAEQRTTRSPDFGFSGDPSRALAGSYYGYLSFAGFESPPAEETTPPTQTAPSPAAPPAETAPAPGATPPAETTPPPVTAAPAPAGQPAPDRTAPSVKIVARRVFRVGRKLSLKVSCPTEACTVTVTGAVTSAGRAVRAARVPRATRRIAKGGEARVDLRLSSRSLAATRRALGRRRLVIRLVVTGRDAAANATTVRRSARLTR